MPRQTWDEYFLSIAETVASRSKDPSTKTGAVIIRPDKTIVATGYNGFPRDIEDDPLLLNNREEKYRRVVHCEMNAILTAREPLHGYTLYTWPFLSCERCAVHVIQAGIKRAIAPAPSIHALERWAHSLELTRRLFREANVAFEEVMTEAITPNTQRCPCCGQEDYRYVPVNGHYETDCCHQIVASCCEGPVSALA